jgi:hypothetical protein
MQPRIKSSKRVSLPRLMKTTAKRAPSQAGHLFAKSTWMKAFLKTRCARCLAHCLVPQHPKKTVCLRTSKGTRVARSSPKSYSRRKSSRKASLSRSSLRPRSCGDFLSKLPSHCSQLLESKKSRKKSRKFLPSWKS